jgi:AcrR family transcriptional regulator
VRADAQRNRERLLLAAVELLLEVGAEPALDAIARRADVGIGTLYRHFPDRDRLLHAVAAHTLARGIEAAEAALADGSDGHDALRRYVHAAVDHGVGVLNLLHPLLDDPDWTDERARMDTLLQSLLARGREDGRLRPEARTTDIVFAVIRFSRPVALGLSRTDERALAHRHLDIYLDGLGTGDPDRPPLPEPPVLGRWPG